MYAKAGVRSLTDAKIQRDVPGQKTSQITTQTMGKTDVVKEYTNPFREGLKNLVI